jgi:flagella basal body P-ring formation protein FlgA
MHLLLKSTIKYLPFLGIALSTSLLFSQPTQASQNGSDSENQPMQVLYDMVLKHLKQKTDQKIHNPTYDIRKFSDRLRLPRCQKPLELEDKAPQKTVGRMTFKLQCPKPEWKIFVTATVEGDLPVVISTKGILKQAVIQPGDVKQVFMPYQKVRRGALVNVERAVGMRAKRAIPPNTILKVRQLQPPYMVFEDNNVTIITRVGNIKVKSLGIALKNGVKNQQIPVRNLSSQKIVKGIVIAPNTVVIP